MLSRICVGGVGFAPRRSSPPRLVSISACVFVRLFSCRRSARPWASGDGDGPPCLSSLCTLLQRLAVAAPECWSPGRRPPWTRRYVPACRSHVSRPPSGHCGRGEEQRGRRGRSRSSETGWIFIHSLVSPSSSGQTSPPNASRGMSPSHSKQMKSLDCQ